MDSLPLGARRGVSLVPYQSSRSNYSPRWATVQAITFSRTADFYDVHVPFTNNYFAAGAFHHNSGKDHAAARIALWWAATHDPSKVVIAGPSYRQVAEVVWQELRTAYLRAYPSLGGRVYESPRLRWGEERFILGFATDKPYKLQGLHSPNLLVIVTEAHGMAQSHVNALWRLNPKRMLMTGNPICEGGEFFDAFHAQAHVWKTLTITAWDTPNFIDGEGTIPGLVEPSDERLAAQRWGEDSPLYRITYGSEWVEGMGSTVVVPLSLALKAESATYEPGLVEVIACDVARHGTDRTVVWSRRGRVCRKLYVSQGHNLMATAGYLNDLHEQRPWAHIVVDGVGLGAGVIDRLRELNVGVIEFIGGAGASDPSQFANRVAECWWRMREGYEDGLDVDSDPDLRAQVTTRKYEVQSDKRIRLQDKEEIRALGRPSPDEGDSLAMTFALDWDVTGADRLRGESDVTATHRNPLAGLPGVPMGNAEEYRDYVLEHPTLTVGRGSKFAPFFPSRWTGIRKGHRRDGHDGG